MTNSETSWQEWWDTLKQESSKEVSEVLFSAEMCADIIGDLTDARIKKGITRKQLAKKCGVKPFTIARIEEIKMFPKLDLLIKISVALGVRISILNEAPSLSDEIIKSLTDFQDLMRILKKVNASHQYVVLTPVDIVNLYDGITYLLDRLIEKQNKNEEIENG